MHVSLICQICRASMTLECHLERTARIFLCSKCQHREIEHEHPASQPGSLVDYKEYFDQFEKDQALEALFKTRKRQATDLKDALIEMGETGPVLDMGTGLGIFPALLKENGWKQAVGADASKQLVEQLNSKGIQAALVAPELTQSDMEMLQRRFAPEIISFLDVIEHFQKLSVVSESFSNLKSLKILVVKVPMSEGLLFRIAKLIARWTKRGPLLQLLQVGTFPPHYHYFSRASLGRFIENSGFEVIHEINDFDFEPTEILYRIKSLQGLAGLLSKPVGMFLAVLIRSTRAYDTQTLVARKKT